MAAFLPEDLAAWTGGKWTARPTGALAGFSVDTRQLQPGEIFVALRTEKRDGHDFLAVAAERGAGAALVSKADATVSLPQLVVSDPLQAFQTIAREHRRRFTGPVIGISGSAGKTSTKDLLAVLLGGEAQGVLATAGNLNNHLGVPLTLTRLEQRHRFAVIEAGISEVGEMDMLAGMIEPDVAVITLVAAAHTEQLGGLDGVAREKSRLPAAVRPTGLAIFPRQAAEYSAFRELGGRTLIIERAEVIRPSEPPHDKVFYAVSHRDARTAVSLAYGTYPLMTFHFRRVSDGMAQNAVLAICAALGLGVSRAEIQQRLGDWQPAKLRGEIRHEGGRLLYLDCYNANPASMADALATFESIAPAGEPRLYVLGTMEELGPEAARYHRELGRKLHLNDADRVFAVGRFAAEICAGVLDLGDYSRQIQIAGSLDTVAAALSEWQGAVFVKGSRRYQLEKILERPASAPAAC